MQISSANLAAMYQGFKAVFQENFSKTEPIWDKVATRVPSTTASESYGWMGAIPGMRKWIGDRYINNLSMSDYSIRNEPFELTVGVDRDRIEDDQYGIYAPMFANLGYEARVHPDKLVFGLLAAGFNTACYDGQYFFDTDHPVMDADGNTVSVSNVQAGTGNPWFLLDTSRPLRPLIFQERKKPNFVALNREQDENVFMRKEYVYGVDSRCNVGFAFWQQAFGSKAALTPENFDTAVNAMSAVKNDRGNPLGIRPNLLVCGPSNNSAARRIIKAQLVDGGNTNIHYEQVDLLVVPWLA